MFFAPYDSAWLGLVSGRSSYREGIMQENGSLTKRWQALSLPVCAIISTILLFSSLCCAGASEISIRIDQSSGAWTGLLVGARNVISRQGEDVRISWRGGELPTATNWKLISVDRGKERVRVVRRAADWVVTTRYSVRGGEVRRCAVFKWMGKNDVVVTGTSLSVPNLRLSNFPDDYYILPSSHPIQKHLFYNLRNCAVSRESWWLYGKYDLAAIHSKRSQTSLLIGYSFNMDDENLSVEENDHCVTIRQDFYTSTILKPGQSIDCGTQVIRIVSGNEDKMRSEMSRFASDLIGGPPSDRPAYLKKCIICEAHPWGRLETWDDNKDRGNRYSRLTKLIPYYKDLGINTLWLLPVSCKPPWVYTLPAFDYIDPQNGSPEELRKLVAAAHKNDIKMLIDLVVYGISPSSPEVDKLPPDCWCYDEKGGIVYSHPVNNFDHKD